MQLISSLNHWKLPIEQCCSSISGWCGQQQSQSAYATKQIRQFEQYLFDDRLSAAVLMRRAARVCYELIYHRYDYYDTVNIVCGGGNNGADGIALAAICAQHGQSVNLVLTSASLTQLGSMMLDWAKSTNVTICDISATANPLETWQTFKQQHMDEAAIWVDALFGIGLNRPIQGVWQQIIVDLNLLSASKPLLSIDIPSGLNADTGAVVGICVKATMTMTFLALKTGCITNHGRQQCGDLYLSSLLLHDESEKLSWLQSQPKVNIFLVNNAAAQMLTASHASHKNSWGSVLVLSGNQQMKGATELVIQGVLAGGCGKVRTICDYPLTNMSQSLLGSWDNLDEYVNQHNSIVIGPGMIESDENCARLEKVLSQVNAQCKIVIDAGALALYSQIFGDDSNTLADTAQTILTPHPKEAAKMLNCSLSDIVNNRTEACQMLANKFQSVVLLKGSGTVITQPYSATDMIICPQGNALLATGGTGDMLAGLLGALLARTSMSDIQACALATAAIGFCSDKLAVVHGSRGLHLSELNSAVRRLLFGAL